MSERVESGAGAGLYDLNPCRRDPLYHLLRDRWHLSPLQCWLLFLGAYGLLPLLAMYDGNWGPRAGLDQSWHHGGAGPVMYIGIIPIAAALTMRFYRQAQSTFERLFADGVVAAKPEEYRAFLRRLDRRYNSTALLLLALAIAVTAHGWLAWQGQQDGRREWNDIDAGLAGRYHVVMLFIPWYLGVTVCLKAIITARAMHSIFEWPVRLEPLHPDGCGGLKRLTDITVTLTGLISLGVLALVLLVSEGKDPFSPALALVLVVIALTPTVFFSCLGRAHRVMSAAKERALGQLNQRVRSPYAALQEGMEGGTISKEAADEVLQISRLHDFVKQMPVWPANTRIVMQIVMSVVLPLTFLAIRMSLQYILPR